MTEQTPQTLILRDHAGNLYAIPHSTLAASRVPTDQLPALQQALGEEVAGYLFAPVVQNDFLPLGTHTASSPTFIGGLVGFTSPVTPTVQNEAIPH